MRKAIKQFYDDTIYMVTKTFLLLFMKLWHRAEIIGKENIPKNGPCMVAPNHVSFLDPPFISAAFYSKRVYFLARDDLFKGFMAWYLPKLGVIPLSREKGDIGALRTGLDLLKRGKMLCLFPEGTRSLDGEIQEAKGGVAFMVVKGACPVLPVYIMGTYEAKPKNGKGIRRTKVKFIIGKPIYPEDLPKPEGRKPDYQAVGNLVMERIAELDPRKEIE
jgi:1-acyl-sn-glycerol-3-phosphate acyltransferase